MIIPFLRPGKARRERDIIVNQDVRRDEITQARWCCSKSPVTLTGKKCKVCGKQATSALMYYWNPSSGLGGRTTAYLCSDHGIEFAKRTPELS